MGRKFRRFMTNCTVALTAAALSAFIVNGYKNIRFYDYSRKAVAIEKQLSECQEALTICKKSDKYMREVLNQAANDLGNSAKKINDLENKLKQYESMNNPTKKIKKNIKKPKPIDFHYSKEKLQLDQISIFSNAYHTLADDTSIEKLSQIDIEDFNIAGTKFIFHPFLDQEKGYFKLFIEPRFNPPEKNKRLYNAMIGRLTLDIGETKQKGTPQKIDFYANIDIPSNLYNFNIGPKLAKYIIQEKVKVDQYGMIMLKQLQIMDRDNNKIPDHMACKYDDLFFKSPLEKIPLYK